MRLTLMLTFFLSFPAAAMESSRPMSQMHGGCTNFKLDIKEDLKAFQSNAIPFGPGARLTPGQFSELKLESQGTVKFEKAPQKLFSPKGETFAAIYTIHIPKASVYRFAAGSKVWFDVLDRETKSFVEPTSFEMQSGCESVFKVVRFELSGPKDYVIQFNGNPSAQLKFLARIE